MENGIAIVGFGEAASTFAAAGNWRGAAHAYDIDPGRAAAMRGLGVERCGSLAQLLSGASLILSLVTADRSLDVARAAATSLAPGALWCDLNSVAPDTKRKSARVIAAAGGNFVDGAIMAPVRPAALGVPLLLAGELASRAADQLRAVGFRTVRVVDGGVGRASAIKMIRSVMVKGIEALTDEMMRAAEAAGVVDEILASLDASEERGDWAKRAEYNLQRMEEHGQRRAAEMIEAAKTLSGVGVEPLMTRATIQRQLTRARKMGERTK